MAITLGVGPVENFYGAFDQTTLAVTLTGTTVGRSIIVGCYWFDNAVTLTSVSCSGESNLTIHGSPMTMASGPTSIQYASLANNTAGGDKTITMTISGTKAMGLFAFEIDGGNLGGLYDTSTGTNTTSTDPTHSITTGFANDLVVGMCVDTGGALSTGTGYTGITMTDNVYTQHGEYKLDAGTAGSKSVPFVNGTSAAWLVGLAAFKAAVAPVTITPGAGSLALTGQTALAYYSDTQKTPPVANALALNGNAPTVTNSGVLNKIPNAGALALTGAAPSVSNTVDTAHGSASLEVMTGAGINIESPYTHGSASLEAITATGTATQHQVASGSASLEAITGVGYGPVFGRAALQPVVGAGHAGIYTSGSASLQPIVANANFAFGRASLEPPQSVGFSTAALLEVYKTIVMNTRNLGITEYQNFGFTGYVFFNGSYYGSSPDGLFLLDGSDDAGANIDWSYKTGQMDDKSPFLKRLPEVLFGLRSSGPIRVRVWKDDNQYFDYMLPATKLDTIHQQRVLPGRGMRSRYYAVEIQSVDNSAAEIDSMQVNMVKTTRRVG